MASDHAYRETDLAIDFSATFEKKVADIVNYFEKAGARSKISSIHVNGCFGTYDKLAMTRLLFEEVFNKNMDKVKEQTIFMGDSPNDVPMFAYFPLSVGVANVRRFKKQLIFEPAWITKKKAGRVSWKWLVFSCLVDNHFG